MKAARKIEAATDHLGRPYPSNDGLSCVFRQFKLNRFFGFTLDHRNAFANAIIFDQVSHGEFD